MKAFDNGLPGVAPFGRDAEPGQHPGRCKRLSGRVSPPLAATQAPAVIDAATTRYPAGCLSPLAVTSNLFLTEPVVHQFRGTPFEPDLRQAIAKLGEMLPDGAPQAPGFCVFADLRTARS